MTTGKVPEINTSSLYLEDLEVGQIYTSAGRTVTEADVVNFAGVSGDFNPIHMDAEFGKGTLYGQRIVFGLLVMAMLTGLLDKSRLFNGTAIAILGIKDWKFAKPVFIGDTIKFEMEITSVRRVSSGDRGVVGRYFRIVNQKDDIVQEGSIDLMIRARKAIK